METVSPANIRFHSNGKVAKHTMLPLSNVIYHPKVRIRFVSAEELLFGSLEENAELPDADSCLEIVFIQIFWKDGGIIGMDVFSSHIHIQRAMAWKKQEFA
jgi:hypothetical protein